MKTLARYLSPLSPCGYLPDQSWQLEYVDIERIEPGEYAERLLAGWRRFGRSLFRPVCPVCRACRSLRIDVARFRPDRSQRRARKANEADVLLSIGPPSLSKDKLDLYDRFHAARARSHGWSMRFVDPWSYAESFLDNPIPTEEWRYTLGGSLVGVGYVDSLPIGLSAIYFVHDPDHQARSLGTWNVLRLIDEARERGLPHVYLGYRVRGCPSLEYKSRFRPHQILGIDGVWRDETPSGDR